MSTRIFQVPTDRINCLWPCTTFEFVKLDIWMDKYGH